MASLVELDVREEQGDSKRGGEDSMGQYFYGLEETKQIVRKLASQFFSQALFHAEEHSKEKGIKPCRGR